MRNNTQHLRALVLTLALCSYLHTSFFLLFVFYFPFVFIYIYSLQSAIWRFKVSPIHPHTYTHKHTHYLFHNLYLFHSHLLPYSFLCPFLFPFPNLQPFPTLPSNMSYPLTPSLPFSQNLSFMSDHPCFLRHHHLLSLSSKLSSFSIIHTSPYRLPSPSLSRRPILPFPLSILSQTSAFPDLQNPSN